MTESAPATRCATVTTRSSATTTPDPRRASGTSNQSDRAHVLYRIFDTNPFHYDFATFEWICEGTGLTPEYWGDWQTPKNQKMIVFTKA